MRAFWWILPLLLAAAPGRAEDEPSTAMALLSMKALTDPLD